MLAPLSVSRAICCGRAAYLCYQSPLLNIMTKQNSKNNIHPAALQMRKADKLFIYYQLNKLGLSGRVCRREPLGVLGKNAGIAGRDGEIIGAPPSVPLRLGQCQDARLAGGVRILQKSTVPPGERTQEAEELWCSGG